MPRPFMSLPVPSPGPLLRALAALSLIAAPAWSPAWGQDLSETFAAWGIGGARAELEAQAPAPGSNPDGEPNGDPDRALALAATHFLGGIEAALQARWRIGATQPLVPLPVLGSTLPDNPDPAPMTEDFLNAIMRDLSTAMQQTRAALPEAPAVLELDLRALWLDVDGNGARSPGEEVAALIGLPLPEGPARVRFDAADVHWLRAYTHMIEGTASLILAFDPTPALAERIALDAALDAQFAQPPGQMARAPSLDAQAQAWGPLLDRIAVVLATLRHAPDPALTAEAGLHLQEMVAANRRFWEEVARETDDDREWIPNDAQRAALGFDLPPQTGPMWLAILDEVEGALEGRLLIPHWRFAPGHGIDLAHWLRDPVALDVVPWIQGPAALPYARPGLTIGRDSWDRFTGSFRGPAGLYMLLLN